MPSIETAVDYRSSRSPTTPEFELEVHVGAQGEALDFIREVATAAFRRVHGVELRIYARDFLILRPRGARDYSEGACLSFSSDGEAFFSEVYLDAPSQVVISKIVGRTVPRREVTHFGTFAATHSRYAAEMVRIAAITLWKLGFRYCFMTAVANVRNMLARHGYDFRHLYVPSLESLEDELERARWGLYYEHGPVTGFASLREPADLRREMFEDRYREIETELATLRRRFDEY